MSYVTEIFSAGLTQALEADAVTLPLTSGALADLTKLLEEDGAYTYASVKSDSTFETVKLYLSSGTLVMDRAQEGTDAVKHPCGSLVCLVSPTIIAAMKSIICEYDCCEGDCPCTGVTFAGAFLPVGTVNSEWEGCVLFTGSMPMSFGVTNQPSWLTVKAEGGTVRLSGTPNAAGKVSLAVAASNCSGTAVALWQGEITINAAD